MFEVFHFEAFAQGYADDELARGAVHGEYVGYVDHGRFVAEVSEVGVGEVEVYALHEHVGGDEHLALGVGEHGAVVAHAFEGAGVLRTDVLREVFDESELTEF